MIYKPDILGFHCPDKDGGYCCHLHYFQFPQPSESIHVAFQEWEVMPLQHHFLVDLKGLLGLCSLILLLKEDHRDLYGGEQLTL